MVYITTIAQIQTVNYWKDKNEMRSLKSSTTKWDAFVSSVAVYNYADKRNK